MYFNDCLIQNVINYRLLESSHAKFPVILITFLSDLCSEYNQIYIVTNLLNMDKS